jgi:hypothetical protein
MRTLVILSLVVCASCRDAGRQSAGRTAPSGLPPAAATTAVAPAPAEAPAPGAAGEVTLSGTLLERIDAPPYTYLRVATPAGEEWAAVSQTGVAVGEKVTVTGTTMQGFQSKTLQRQFDRIVFGTLASAPAPAPTPSAAAAASHPSPTEPGLAHTAAPASAGEKLPVAEGPGATTIADLFANRAALAGKEVAVRGKVVKVNSGILGKTWIHLQDGSGSAANADHDITVTTVGSAKLDDVVTVRGALRLDKDLGSGYRYTAIIEDATIQQ